MVGSTALVNLCFHGIGTPGRDLEPGEDRYWVTVDAFHRILDEIADEPRVRISFDDGNASDLVHAVPALRERGLTGTFFVLAGRLGSRGSLDADDVRGLAEAGMRIGSHGLDHVPWRHLSGADLRRELVEARDRIAAAAGVPVVDAALPLGRYDRRVLAEVRRQGYTSLHTSDRAWSREGAWLQPRFSVCHDDTAGTVRRVVQTRAPLPQRVRSRGVRLAKRLR